mgnify:FL=1|jgi:hypothetical protein
MARIQSTGKCCFCSSTFNKSAMTRHLKSCKEREAKWKSSLENNEKHRTKFFHLLVEGRYLPEYWMHLLVKANITLDKLDTFLRDIWLECCGHLSAFTIEDRTYTFTPFGEYEEKSMRIKLNEVLSPGMKFYYEYDFGTTTHLTLKVISEIELNAKGKFIRIMARNDPPERNCVVCGKPATQVCVHCIREGMGWLCDECAPKHKCGEDMLLPVVNSPRVGKCGYTGD